MEDHELVHLLLFLEAHIILPVDVGESPLAAHNNFLAAGEFVTGAAEGLLDNWCVRILATNGQDDLADVDTSDCAIGLSPCTTHTGLKPVQDAL